ncbi:MAG: HAD family hydrolase [Rhodospirillales bacterium]|nr:HAD family hydrolase [Rhodospirillales bacterium]
MLFNCKAVFLDRDGVLNSSNVREGKPYAPTCIEDFSLLPGVAEAVKALHENGYMTIVVTNQPDLTTGKVSADTVEAFHECLRAAMPIDDIIICPHLNEDNCSCRKPKPGMILQAAQKYRIDLTKSIVVGDRWRDIDAADAAGCVSYFIEYGYDEPLKQKPNFIVKDLAEAVHMILTEN